MLRGLIFLIFIAHASLAQFNFVIDQNIPVSLENGNTLSMPWAGGLNAARVNTIDINGDGVDDLVIFDRTASRVITFVRNNGQYQYAPQYENLFPSDINAWLLLRDYNGDGKKDIFTNINNDVKVYLNVTPAGEALKWQHVLFFDGPGSKSQVVLTKGTSFKINVHMNSNDIPSFNDADGDGDLDLFVPKFSSGATIEYHKNFSVERYGTLDSLDFERITLKWGGITECGCGEFAFNNDPCSAGGKTNHAGGKNLFSLDVDNDGDYDMLFSEEGEVVEGGCSQLFLLENIGTNATPIVTQAVPYPPSSPAVISTFPAAAYEDVDSDGKKDLIVSPNLAGRQFLSSDFSNSVWVYKNTGTNALPIFTTSDTNFLQENMIDVGDNAVPAFFDADGDADLDMFIGYYAKNFRGSIQYFENTGTTEAPAYQRITNDYRGMSFLSLLNVKPAFADMNSDGRIDLTLTATSMIDGLTRLFYFPNRNYIGANFEQLPVATSFVINPADNVSIIDVDFDGSKDLLVGKANGSIEYWKRINGEYILADATYLGFSSSIAGKSPFCTVEDLNADGKTDLLISNQSGSLQIINDFRNATDASPRMTDIIYDPIHETYTSQNLGGQTWATTANIFRSNISSIIVGNVLGGIHILRAEQSVLEKTPVIDIYPNPIAQESAILTIKVDQPAAVAAYTALGKEMGSPVQLQAHENYNYALQGFSKGIYLLRFTIAGKSIVRRIVVY
jgi:hypothetical protein